ncbi:MAG TPA: hypothetical protein VG868_12875, partial [Casimicrobiaceae bacterium]|nr:hypothetical protein [Casimicrobiaceae bacterium]
ARLEAKPREEQVGARRPATMRLMPNARAAGCAQSWRSIGRLVGNASSRSQEWGLRRGREDTGAVRPGKKRGSPLYEYCSSPLYCREQQ